VAFLSKLIHTQLAPKIHTSFNKILRVFHCIFPVLLMAFLLLYPIDSEKNLIEKKMYSSLYIRITIDHIKTVHINIGACLFFIGSHLENSHVKFCNQFL